MSPRVVGPVDAFVSFTGADVAWAEWIAAALEEAGYTTRLQSWDFGVGSNFVAQMNAVLEDAERLVMVTSSRYWNSVMATAEWQAAFARDPTSLAPIRIEDADPPALLAPIVHVDVFGVSEADARARVVQALQGPGRPVRLVRFPGSGVRRPAMPAIFEAPRRPAPLAGRDEVLAELRQRLAGMTQTLAGGGGVGKTVLAAEYAWRYRSDYALVWWVPAEQRPLILDSYIRLAGELDVAVPDDLEALPRLIHRALDASAGRWLLVFDNAPDFGAVAPFLPRGDGHVLITSRNPAWGGPSATIDVECLDQSTAARYLLTRLKGEPSEAERAGADALAVELGGLPLALAQAGAYLDTYGETLAGYLGLFRGMRARLLADGPCPLDYKGTVYTTVNLALSRLAAEPAALALLELLAFLGPEPIPLDLLLDTETVELPAELACLAGPGRGHERNRLGIGPLRAVSLIEREPAGVKVHRLTQTVLLQEEVLAARRGGAGRRSPRHTALDQRAGCHALDAGGPGRRSHPAGGEPRRLPGGPRRPPPWHPRLDQ
ncbi:MAG: TIR domain-containing protein [Egibacteraceae bacterium]